MMWSTKITHANFLLEAALRRVASFKAERSLDEQTSSVGIPGVSVVVGSSFCSRLSCLNYKCIRRETVQKFSFINSRSDRGAQGQLELLDALCRRGISAGLLSWQDPSLNPTRLAQFTHITFLTCNQCSRQIGAFHAFVKDALITAQCLNARICILNDPYLVLWNSYKTYLAELAVAGFEVPPVQYLDPGQPMECLEFALASRVTRHDPVVLKPSGSASGAGTHLISERTALSDDDKAALSAVKAAVHNGGCISSIMFQDLTPDIHNGEYSLVYINSRSSYAFWKKVF